MSLLFFKNETEIGKLQLRLPKIGRRELPLRKSVQDWKRFGEFYKS